MSNTLSPEELVEKLNSDESISSSVVFHASTQEEKVRTPVITESDSSDELNSSEFIPSSDAAPTLDFDGIDIANPVELLLLIEPKFMSGESKLHAWQIKFMMDFANGKHTKDSPFQAEVEACNGSGKDKFIVALCAVWLCMRYKDACAVGTNGSGVQLDNQTEKHINYFCERVNSVFGGIWKCNYRYYECLPTRSPIVLFATDEANKAEGYHPVVEGGRMAIFVSEAKAVTQDIFEALGRCMGFTHRVDVSSPSLNPSGYFYHSCSTALPREDIEDIKTLKSTQCILYHVSAYDCSHISEAEIETFAAKLPGGRNSPVFKSGILAERGTGTGEMIAIPYTFVWRAVNTPPKSGWIRDIHNRGGLDLSDGGDETVLTVRNGNKHLATIPFRFDNTEDTIEFLEEKFREHELSHPEAYIYADCGGLGKPMLDRLRRKGWSNIRYVDNRHKAHEPRTYLNVGTELWFHTRQLFERHEIYVLNDKTLIEQLSTRYYKIDLANRHRLLSKLESRAQGYPSPDRADSFVLSFWDYKSHFKPEDSYSETTIPFETPKEEMKVTGDFSLKSWAKNGNGRYRKYNLNGGVKDFSFLQEEIAENNRQILNRR